MWPSTVRTDRVSRSATSRLDKPWPSSNDDLAFPIGQRQRLTRLSQRRRIRSALLGQRLRPRRTPQHRPAQVLPPIRQARLRGRVDSRHASRPSPRNPLTAQANSAASPSCRAPANRAATPDARALDNPFELPQPRLARPIAELRRRLQAHHFRRESPIGRRPSRPPTAGFRSPR